ncbi:MAG: PEGA domain-containing protein [Halioglobus sp.]
MSVLFRQRVSFLIKLIGQTSPDRLVLRHQILNTQMLKTQMLKARTVKRLVRSALAGAVLIFTGVISADELPRLAVVDFTSSTSTAYRKSLPELIVDELVNRGDFDVLEREKLDTLAGEIAFQSSTGLVDPGTAVQVGGMLGARILITGHILDHGSQRKQFSGYGIRTTKTTYRLKARLEAIDVTTGSKLFSNVAQASKEVQAIQGQIANSTQKDLGSKVAKKLVDAFVNSKRIQKLVAGDPETVSVTIRSDPPEADLEVDGTYYGNTGQEIKLIPGTHNITVSLPGYVDWNKRVMVQQGTTLKARLQKDTAIRTESKVELEVKQ